MTILPHNEHDGQMLYTVIEKFFAMFRVGDLLRKCNAGKEKGVPVMKVFRYLTSNVIEAMFQTAKSLFHVTDEQLEVFAAEFYSRLPKYMKRALHYTPSLAA